jgi:hypothetical protein
MWIFDNLDYFSYIFKDNKFLWMEVGGLIILVDNLYKKARIVSLLLEIS